MHFWIDKRSPQCGFGRSRVAASLHTGSSGLSFGHPPRRSGGHKSLSSTANTAFSATSNTGVQVHRQQHQHQPYHGHIAMSNNAQYRLNNYPSGSSSSSSNTIVTSNNNNNVNTATNHSMNRNFVRSNTTASYHYYNNNRQQQQQAGNHHYQHHQSNCSLPNSSNNNISGTTQTLTSPTGNNLNCTSLNSIAFAATTTAITQQHHSLHLQHQQQPHAQRYRHPQFGNMSVRTYQPSITQQQIPPITATITTTMTAQTHHQQQTQMQLTPTSTNTTSIYHNSITTATTTAGTTAVGAESMSVATNQLQQSLDASLNTVNERGTHQHQSPNQTANLFTEQFQTSPRIVITSSRPLTTVTMSPAIYDHNNLSANPHTNNDQNNHQYHNRRAIHSIESTDLQFVPLHLKCRVFGSLVLAMAFIAGINVYYENHGTKLQVGLFWLLTAISVFAFCFVSICKAPRILFACITSSRWNSRNQTRNRCSRGDPIAAAIRVSMNNSIDDVVISGLHEFQQEQIQSINVNPQAEPPPYHIAILLPETKGKESVSTMEESPPPSYDKILI